MHQQSVASSPQATSALPTQQIPQFPSPWPEHQAPCQPRGVTSRKANVRLALGLCSQTDDWRGESSPFAHTQGTVTPGQEQGCTLAPAHGKAPEENRWAGIILV